MNENLGEVAAENTERQFVNSVGGSFVKPRQAWPSDKKFET